MCSDSVPAIIGQWNSFGKFPRWISFASFGPRPPASRFGRREWRCALAARGLDYIHPVPLVDPRTMPPPPELGQAKHFNYPTAVFIAYEKNYQDSEKY